MKLNEKYEKLRIYIDEQIDRVSDDELPAVMAGIVLRQLLELHQKIDGIQKTTDNIEGNLYDYSEMNEKFENEQQRAAEQFDRAENLQAKNDRMMGIV